MNLSIVIPVTDKHELTDRCIRFLHIHSELEPEIIVIDNGSLEPYQPVYDEQVIRNDQNIGVFPALLQGISAATNNIVMTMHNDVLVHEPKFDTRILKEFANDSLLGIAGFFGGRGVSENGGRDHAESNMQGLEWGMSYHQHSHLQPATHPAVVFDSLALILNKEVFYNVFPPEEQALIAPHHWYDRIVTLGIVMAGYHALTIGVAFDHYGGGTSVANTAFSDFTERWVQEKGLPLEQNADYTMYMYGERYFRNKWRGKFPIRVDKNFNLTFAGKGRDIADL